MTILLFGISSSALSQVDDSLEKLTSKNAKNYLQPLADAFGANLNSGFFYSARIPRFGLSVRVGISAMIAPIPSDKKAFALQDEKVGDFWVIFPENAPPVPTVFGKEQTVPINIDGSTFNAPGGIWDTDFFPMAVPQITVGSFLGTEAMVRYFKYNHSDIGEIKLSGFGLRHSLSQYIPLFPIHVALGIYRQTFTIGDIVEARTMYYGLQASKKLAIITFYAGYGIESCKLDLNYTYVHGNQQEFPIGFEFDSVNRTRINAGLAFDLLILKIYADYSMADQSVICVGTAIGF